MSILIAGNPNSGKTTVFNALTGGRGRVGNYPGVTVDRRAGKMRGANANGEEVVDLPGTYSLSARSAEEQVAVNAVLGRGADAPDVVVMVVDATALGRSLYYVLQVVDTGLSVVVALNMMDEAGRAGLQVDADALAEALGAAVVPVVASSGRGIDALRCAALAAAHGAPKTQEPLADDAAHRDADEVGASFAATGMDLTARQQRAWGLWALLSVAPDDELTSIPDEVRETVASVRDRAEKAGRDLDLEIIGSRYARIDEIVARVTEHRAPSDASRTERIDRVLMHPVWGLVFFMLIMGVVFEGLFSWSEPAIDVIEALVGAAQRLAGAHMPAGALRGLVVEGILGGVGNVLVFIPQIAFLFFGIAFLEDSGYLARVAFALDRIMGRVGLHGRAFVPLLSGFACAVPAVLATRTIESRRDRLLTMLVVPFTSCSARLPVYVMITAAVFPVDNRIFGVVSVGAAALFGIYALSIATALIAAAVLRRTVLAGPRPPLVLELPPYRMPLATNLVATTWDRLRSFLVEAGTIILAMSIVLWALLSYPRDGAVTEHYEGLRDEVASTGAARAEALSALAAEEGAAQVPYSVAGRIGHAMEPVLEPLGFDWRIGIGLMGAFAAREVFVSTLGTVFGMEEGDEHHAPLREELRRATWPDGRRLITRLSALSLMVFFLFACQCMSTIAVVKRESGGWRWPIFMVIYMGVLAYGAALVVYQTGAAFGWGLG